MKKRTLTLVALAAFLLGVGVTLLAKKKGTDPLLYLGKEPAAAAASLLEMAEVQADKGSWERIAIGRVYYLSGDTERGQAYLDRVLNGKHDADDLERIARLYLEAGEWDKAAPLVQKVASMGSDDEDALVWAGALYNLHGDREQAEKLFNKSFKEKDDDFWNTLAAAGSYLGVEPD